MNDVAIPHEHRLVVVAAKAFGDLVIAASVIRRLEQQARQRVGLFAGDHLAELLGVLGLDCETVLLAHGEAGVPAVFDLRRCGLRSGLASGWRLRRLIAREAGRFGPATLLFDRLGPRERLISGALPALSLPDRPNIYAAYADRFRSLALPVRPVPAPARASERVMGIFPGSRLGHKVIPPSALEALVQSGRAAGWTSSVFTLDGEATPTAGLAATRIPRTFAALGAAIRSVGAVVSADSLPAHLAEYLARPVFVVSPVDNHYWLPFTAYQAGAWAVFANRAGIIARLAAFLADVDVAGPSFAAASAGDLTLRS